LVYIPSNRKIISSKNLNIREELNYNDEFLKDILEKDYSSLIKYFNTDFNNNNNIQSRINELEDQETYSDNQENKLITEENTIIIEVPESYLIQQGYPRIPGGYLINQNNSNSDDSANNNLRPTIRSLTKDQKETNTRAKETETCSKTILALNKYIKDFNFNFYSLVSVVYIANAEEDTSKTEPIIIPKSHTESLIEPKSHQETMNLLFKNY
jgi:hypothetical protein